jgi:ABC-2 type transport system ATP-binding protein
VFGLLGPNGAGKTTLQKILLGIVHPSGGEASLFGQPAGDPSARERIGFLPENHRFPEFLTAERMLSLYGRLSGVPPSTSSDRIPELLDRVGLADRSDSKVGTFSKGMLQRLGLAQALLSEPDLLFLDEPTDGVDPVGRRAIRDILVWLRDQGTTVFLNSHLLSEVEKVCSQIAILNDGELVRQGTIQELTAVDRVYDLTATPISDDVLDDVGDILQPAETPADAPDLARYRVLADERTRLNDVIDHLRSAGVEIEAVTPVRRTLEDYFIDVVSPTGKATGSPASSAAASDGVPSEPATSPADDGS